MTAKFTGRQGEITELSDTGRNGNGSGLGVNNKGWRKTQWDFGRKENYEASRQYDWRSDGAGIEAEFRLNKTF